MSTIVQEYKLLIDGKWVSSSSGKLFESRNPATGELNGRIAEGDAADVALAAKAARRAFESGPWSRMDAYERGRLMRRIADRIRARQDEIAVLETKDNGKAIRETKAQVAASADYFDYYAGWCDKLEGKVIPVRGGFHTYTVREPIGVVAGIIPWNSPMPQAAQKLAPALAAGCTIVLKPAEQTPITAAVLGQILLECDLPAGVVNIIQGFGSTAGAALVADREIDKIAFTGEVSTGQTILRNAVDGLKRVSLELGGKAPNIVFDDADIERAVKATLFGIFAGAGQYCDAGPRLFLHKKVRERFMDSMMALVARIRVGDPLDPATHIGSLTSFEHLAKVERYVAIGREEGAVVIAGGKRPDEPRLARGCYYLPTIFDKVSHRMRIAQEEIFGPVLSILDFDSEEDVLRMANDVDFGLVAAVWTSDMRRAHRFAKHLKAGTVWINTFRQTQISAPFGGFKKSGIGREKGLSGLEEFTEEKTVWIGCTDDPIGYFDK